MMELEDTWGFKLAARREAKGWTHTQVADAVNALDASPIQYTHNDVIDWEYNNVPEQRIVELLARILIAENPAIPDPAAKDKLTQEFFLAANKTREALTMKETPSLQYDFSKKLLALRRNNPDLLSESYIAEQITKYSNSKLEVSWEDIWKLEHGKLSDPRLPPAVLEVYKSNKILTEPQAVEFSQTIPQHTFISAEQAVDNAIDILHTLCRKYYIDARAWDGIGDKTLESLAWNEASGDKPSSPNFGARQFFYQFQNMNSAKKPSETWEKLGAKLRNIIRDKQFAQAIDTSSPLVIEEYEREKDWNRLDSAIRQAISATTQQHQNRFRAGTGR